MAMFDVAIWTSYYWLNGRAWCSSVVERPRARCGGRGRGRELVWIVLAGHRVLSWYRPLFAHRKKYFLATNPSTRYHLPSTTDGRRRKDQTRKPLCSRAIRSRCEPCTKGKHCQVCG